MVAPNANQRLHPLVDLLVLTSSTLTAGQTLCANFDSSYEMRTTGENAAELPVLLQVTLTL